MKRRSLSAACLLVSAMAWLGDALSVRAAANDNFADAWVIGSIPYSTNGSNSGATKEPGEPNHHSLAGGASLWWSYTPGTTGPVRIDTVGSSFPATLAVYSGTSVGSLSRINSGYGNRNVYFDAVADVTYHIALDGEMAMAGDYVLNATVGARPPANDAFANAFVLTGGSASIAASNTAATREMGEPMLAGADGGRSVWWQWTAPSSGWRQVDTLGSSIDTLLGVYTGTAVDALSAVAEDNNSGNGYRTSRLNFLAAAGVTYGIAVDGRHGEEGSISLQLSPVSPPPENDAFTQSIVIAGASYSVTNASNIGATHEPMEPMHLMFLCYNSTWWQWIAPASGPVQIDTIGSSFDTILAVYTGLEVNSLTTVVDDNNSGGDGASLVAFNAVAGTTYRIAVDGAFGSTGTICLHLAPTAPIVVPINDNFTNATAIPGTVYSITNASNANATREMGEPFHAGHTGGKSVWWSWTSPTGGPVQVDTIGSSFETLLGVYTGEQVSALTYITSDVSSGGNNASRLLLNAVAGVTYRIAVDGFMGATGTVHLQLFPTAPAVAPVNDTFAEAILISGTTYTITNASSVNATKETSEPNHANNEGGRSVWWSWTAPTGGLFQVDTVTSPFDTLLAVYTGATVNALGRIAANDDSGGSTTSLLAFNAVAGTTYRIAVDGWGGASGRVVLHLLPLGPPANDNLANAVVITGSGYTNINASNVNATKEAGEPNHAGNTGGKSVWWSWTAPAAGDVQVDTIGSGFDTLLAVYTGSIVNALTPLAGDDNSGGGGSSLLTFTALSGTTYSIVIDGAAGASGTAMLHLSLSAPVSRPPNDSFANASAINVLPYTNSSASNVDATKENGEPNHADNSGGKSVWWYWVSLLDGNVQVDTIGSGFDTILGVYTGAAVNALTPIASNDDGGGNRTSLLTFNAVAGATYRIAVDGYGGTSGTLELHLTRMAPPAPPANDDFASAIEVTGPAYLSELTDITSATKEAGEPRHNGYAGGKSVWWKWTADMTIRMQAEAYGSTFPSVLGIYTGTAVNALGTLAAGFGNHGVYFDAVEGTTYYLAFDAEMGPGGTFQLNMDFAPDAPDNDQFANAAILSGFHAEVLDAPSLGASKEAGEPNHAGEPGGKSVWWRWTAPVSGQVQLDMGGTSFNMVMGVYTGATLNALTAVTTANGGVALVPFTAVAGTTYHIAVDGFHAQAGSIVLHLDLPVEITLMNPGLIVTNSVRRFAFDVNGPEGGTIVIRQASRLGPADWTDMQTNVLGAGPMKVVDPLPPTNAARFYHAVLP